MTHSPALPRMIAVTTIALLIGLSAFGDGQSGAKSTPNPCKCPAKSALAPGEGLENSALASKGSAAAIGPEDYPCSLKGLVINCDSWKQGDKQPAVLGQKLAMLRKQFWTTYPHKPGSDTATREFAEWLFYKDVSYLQLALMLWKQGRRAQDNPNDLINLLNLGSVVQLDGGIPQSAGPEFYEWVMAVRENFGEPKSTDDFFRHGWEIGFTGSKLQKAMEASRKQYREYLVERDWAEFTAADRTPAGFGFDFERPENYGALLYLREGKLKVPEALFAYCSAEKVLGPGIVQQASKRVLAAPKTAQGDLVQTVRPPVKTGPGGSQLDDDSVPMPDGVIGVYRSQLIAFEKLITLDDDRRYLLGLLTDLNRNSKRILDRSTQWCFAERMYNRYELAFGEPAILQASHAVRTAPKRMTDGWVMDPKSIGSTRMTPYPAFQEVLVRNEPRGYVRALLAFGQDLGTKEAVKTAYQQLIAAHGENAVLEAARKMAAGRPSPTTKGDLDTLTSMLSSASSPERVESPVAAQVDYPQYLAWKGFGPGAKATYVFRGLQPTGRGANQMVPGQVDVRTTYTLQSITDEIAKLWLTEVVYDYPSGQAHPPRDTEIAYPAKIPPRQASAEAPATSGEQVLDIAGKKIATRWQAVRGPGRGCDNVVTIWTSEQVPGGLVRKTEDNNCQGRRIIREAILESFVASPVGTRAVVK